MKKIFFLVLTLVFSTSFWAQVPQSISFQAVVRGSNNELIVKKAVGIKISLLQGSEIGSVVYVESHTPIANENGLVSIAIGNGTKVSGDFNLINWSKGPYFIKIETDPTGSTNYSLVTVSQLLSVPFALSAGNGVERVSSLGDSLVLTNGKSISLSGSNEGDKNTTFFAINGIGQKATNTYQKIILKDNDTIVFNNFNPNNNYNHTTGELTIQKDGTYFFELQIGNAGNCIVKKNGIEQLLWPTGSNLLFLGYGSKSSFYLTSLKKGDVITFWAEGWCDMCTEFSNFQGGFYGYKVE